MSVGLLVNGKLGSSTRGGKSVGTAATARKIAEWFERKHGDLLVRPPMLHAAEDAEHVVLDLYSGTEPVAIVIGNDGTVTAEANTGWGGPGFHKCVCELIDSFGSECGIKWTKDEEADETGYFVDRDWSKLVESIEAWIGALCGIVDEQVAKTEGETMMSIGMPLDIAPVDVAGVLTPLGIRKPAWFARAKRDPNLAAELLGWRAPEPDALCWRNRALAAMWMHVRWCVPRSESEARLNQYVLGAMQAAYDAGDEADLPWAAWKELAELNETPIPSKVVALAEKHADAAPIGYRRGDVMLRQGEGWSIRIPGSMTEEVDPEGGPFWFDEQHAVRFSIFVPEHAGKHVLTAKEIADDIDPPDGDPVATWSEDGILARMVVSECEEDDGETSTNYQALVAAHGQFAMCTVSGEDRSIEEFAQKVCRSIRGPREGDGE